MADAPLSGAAALALLADRLGSATAAGEELRDASRRRLYDTLLAALVGWKLPDRDPLARMPDEGHGRLRKLVATIRATEVDDIAIEGCVTAGAIIVPTALHFAAQRKMSIAAVHDALIAGYEAMIGFASAIGGATILYRGVWPTLAAAPIGAAAVAARLGDLGPAQTRSALALAIGRSVWWRDRSAPPWLMIGQAAVDGVIAAEAAEAGFTATLDVIETWATAAGLEVAGDRLLPAAKWHMLGVETKPFPTARQALSAIEAFRRLHREETVGGTDRIIVGVPEAYRDMIGNTAPHSRMGSLVAVGYQMALCLFSPDRLYDAVRSERLDGPDVEAFLSRVSVEADSELDALFPRLWPARVRIMRSDGREREMLIVSPRDEALPGMEWAELDEKADLLAQANGLDRSAIEALRAAIFNDESPANLLELVS